MTPAQQKMWLYIVGGALAASGLWLEQASATHQITLPPALVLLPGAMGWLGGFLKGKARPAPGAGVDVGPLPKE